MEKAKHSKTQIKKKQINRTLRFQICLFDFTTVQHHFNLHQKMAFSDF